MIEGYAGPFAIRGTPAEVADFLRAAVQQRFLPPGLAQFELTEGKDARPNSLAIHLGNNMNPESGPGALGLLWAGEIARIEVEGLVDAASLGFLFDADRRSDGNIVSLMSVLAKRWLELETQMDAWFAAASTGRALWSTPGVSAIPGGVSPVDLRLGPGIDETMAVAQVATVGQTLPFVGRHLQERTKASCRLLIRVEPCGVATGPHVVECLGSDPAYRDLPASGYGESYLWVLAWLRQDASGNPAGNSFTFVAHPQARGRYLFSPQAVGRLRCLEAGEHETSLELGLAELYLDRENLMHYAARIVQAVFVSDEWRRAISLDEAVPEPIGLTGTSQVHGNRLAEGEATMPSLGPQTTEEGMRRSLAPTSQITREKWAYVYTLVEPWIAQGVTIRDMAARLRVKYPYLHVHERTLKSILRAVKSGELDEELKAAPR